MISGLTAAASLRSSGADWASCFRPLRFRLAAWKRRGPLVLVLADCAVLPLAAPTSCQKSPVGWLAVGPSLAMTAAEPEMVQPKAMKANNMRPAVGRSVAPAFLRRGVGDGFTEIFMPAIPLILLLIRKVCLSPKIYSVKLPFVINKTCKSFNFSIT